MSVNPLDTNMEMWNAVRVSDTGRSGKHRAIEAALAENRLRREAADAEADAARKELQKLLGRGDAAGLTVSAMARAAGISRETAHRWLREVRDQEGDHA